jgi:hypothetical protein
MTTTKMKAPRKKAIAPPNNRSVLPVDGEQQDPVEDRPGC